MLSDVQKLIAAVALLLSVVPALATGLADFPTEFSKLLFWCSAIVSPVIVFVIIIYRKAILALPTWKVLSAASVALILGLCFGWTTYVLGREYVYPIQEHSMHDGELVVEKELLIRPSERVPEVEEILDEIVRDRQSFGIDTTRETALELALADADYGETIRQLWDENSLAEQRNMLILFHLAQGLTIFAFLIFAFLAAKQESSPTPEGAPPT